MKKYILARVIFLIMVLVMCFLCACGNKNQFSKEDFESKGENVSTITHSFMKTDDSEVVTYDKEMLQQFQNSIMAQTVEYPYPELFNYEEAIGGIKSGLVMEEHTYSALDKNGKLTKEHLINIVKENNDVYLKEINTSILAPVEDELLQQICKVLVDTTKYVLEQYPDIDRERVYCNLGNLKIIEKKSALDFAAVEPGMVLHVNRNTSMMADVFTSSNMYNVLVHETMHIIQYGCACENIEGCARRCGLAYAYNEREQDYSDWLWLAEGSAERMACLHDNVEPMTYQNLVNYILTLDLAVLLKEDTTADYIETINFYNDLSKLFDAFDAKTEEEKKEIYHMIYSLEIMQMLPQGVKDSYAKIYGEEYTDEVRDRINNEVKRPIVKTITKRFYNNLVNALMSQNLTKNDVLFLLNLFESTIDKHILFESEEHKEYNVEFKEWYSEVQNNFWNCLTNLSVNDYGAYQSYDDTKTVHASMTWLDETKRTFLLEKFEDNMCDYKFIKN